MNHLTSFLTILTAVRRIATDLGAKARVTPSLLALGAGKINKCDSVLVQCDPLLES